MINFIKKKLETMKSEKKANQLISDLSDGNCGIEESLDEVAEDNEKKKLHGTTRKTENLSYPMLSDEISESQDECIDAKNFLEQLSPGDDSKYRNESGNNDILDQVVTVDESADILNDSERAQAINEVSDILSQISTDGASSDT